MADNSELRRFASISSDYPCGLCIDPSFSGTLGACSPSFSGRMCSIGTIISAIRVWPTWLSRCMHSQYSASDRLRNCCSISIALWRRHLPKRKNRRAARMQQDDPRSSQMPTPSLTARALECEAAAVAEEVAVTVAGVVDVARGDVVLYRSNGGCTGLVPPM